MTSKARRFFSGDTLEKTVMQAARYHQVEPEELAYHKLDKRHGFLKVRRGVVIEVDPENPRRPRATLSETAATPDRQAASPEAPPPAVEIAAAASAAEAPPAPEVAAPAAPPAVEAPPAPEVAAPAAPPAVEAPPAPEVAAPAAPPAAEVAREPATESPAGPPRSEPRRSRAPEPPVEPKEERFRAPEPSTPREEAGPAAAPVSEEATLRPIAARSPSGRFPLATGELAEAAKRALAEICEAAAIDVEAEVLQGEDRLEIKLKGRDEDRLLEDEGALLLAIQHLLPRVIRGFADRSGPCRVDCQDFHEIRQEKLRSLAQDIASEVRQGQRSRTLDPMSPEERRIVHLTLADDTEVTTQSQGSGFFKRVKIEPARRRPQGFDPYDR